MKNLRLAFIHPTSRPALRYGVCVALSLTLLAACQEAIPSSSVSAPPAPTNAPPAHPATAPSSSGTEAIVEQVMNQQYGHSFDSKLGCWVFTAELADDSYDYCMKPRTPTRVWINGTEYLYLFAHSRADIEDDPSYSYGQAMPGLMGAFEVRIESSTQWKLVAGTKDLKFGSAGNCGCQDASLVELGKDYYGWQFSSGGVWQGVAVFNHNLVAAHDGAFVDLSAIPKVQEGEQEAEYAIELEESADPVRALLVTRTETGKQPATVRVPFDQQKWRYELPAKN